MDFNDKVLNQIFKLIDELYVHFNMKDEKLTFGRLKGLCDCYRYLIGDETYLLSCNNKSNINNDDFDDYDD